MADEAGLHPQLLRAVIDINRDQRKLVGEKLRRLLGSLAGKRITLYGLTFKPNTDDLRDAPALDIVRFLLGEGATVVGFDPAGMEHAKRLIPELAVAPDPYQAAVDADALVLVTEWNVFKQLDWARLRRVMHQAILIDGRNMYDPLRIRDAGFVYEGIGIGCSSPLPVPR
ncbi:MAG: hypothetical protein M1298_04690 [Chloroflexi bacterium]|nr:hypothetical protein [Chloroflexota bacterium]